MFIESAKIALLMDTITQTSNAQTCPYAVQIERIIKPAG
jgi:hypothetical protein